MFLHLTILYLIEIPIGGE